MEGEVIMSRSAFQLVLISNTGRFSRKESMGPLVYHLDLNFSVSLKMLLLGIAKLSFRTTETWPFMNASFLLSFKSILKLIF